MALSVRPQFRQWDRVGHARSTVEAQFGFGQAIGENTISGFLSSYGAGTIARELMTPQPNVPITDEAPFLSELPRAVGEIGSMIRGDKPEPTISVEEFKASTDYREAIPYETGMTKSRLAALSAMYDVNQARAMMSQKEWGGAFIGQFLGQAGDPINYVPFAGGAMQTAAVARLGGVLGRVSVAALDAAVNTAIFGAATADWRRKFGDAVTFEAIAQEVGMSMVIGGVFGAGMGLLSIPGDRRARDAAMIDAAASRMDGLRDVQGRMAILSDNTSRLARGEDMNPSARVEFERQAAKFQDEIRKQEEVDIARVVATRTVAERADLVAVRAEMESTPVDSPRRVELAQRQVELEDRIQRIDLAYRAQRELVARGVVADGMAPTVRDLPAPVEGTTRLYTQTDPQGTAPVAATVEAPADGNGWYVDVPTEKAAELTARPIEPPAKDAAAAPNVQPITWQSLPKPGPPPTTPFRRLMINRFMEGGRSGEEGLALAKTFEAAYANLSARAGWTPEKMLQEYPLPEVVYRGPERAVEPKAEEGVPVFDDGKPHFYDGAAEKGPDGKPLASETEMLFAPPTPRAPDTMFQSAPPTDTPAFRAWFGSSKVVDADGKPLVVYHGTTKSFDAFERTALFASVKPGTDMNPEFETVFSKGFFFTADENYGHVRNIGNASGGQVYPVFLRIEKPYYARHSGELEGLNVAEDAAEFIQKLRDAGHDGIVWGDPDNLRKSPRGAWGDDRSQIFVFEPTQIKSAIANRGTFDPNDPRILYQPAYHGSPHIFDRFKWGDETRGKGEGAQAFGDGLYFAGKKEVAQYYKEALANPTIDGRPMRTNELNAWAELLDTQQDIQKAISQAQTEVDDLLDRYGADVQSFVIDPYRLKLATLKHWEKDGIPDVKSAGRLYKVDIPHDDELMAWDAPLSEQPPKVREALRTLGFSEGGAPARIADRDLRYIVEAAIKANDGDASRDSVSLVVDNDSDLYQRAEAYAKKRGFSTDAVDEQGGLGAFIESEARDYLSALNARYARTGEKVYRELQNRLGGDAASASAALREAGIPGHRFLDQGSRSDGEGTYNYVIYDDSRVNILDYEQEVRDDASTWQRDDGTSTETPRGQISFKDGKSLIRLFDGADPSTALHEAGHHFLMMIKDMGERTDVGPGIKEDWGTVKGWLAVNAKDVATEAGNGVTPDDVLAVLNRNTSGDKMKDIAINRGIHEQWARGFEAYHLEGKAPSAGMRGVFESFRKWLAAIYASVKTLNVNLTPEIRQVFDRLLTDEPTPEIGIVTAPERPAGAPTLDPPPPSPVDPALTRAAAAVGKSEDIAGFEEQLGARVDGTYNEEGDIDMLRSLGRILPDEETALKAADDGYKDAVAYEKMLQVALACVIP